jgi:hypothetical protein
MKESQPSISDWRNLYEASAQFKTTECWDWMLDSDMFGVQNPANGEIGYCCVMGRLGEHFALAVYLGTEGLGTYMKIRNREITAGDFDALTSQKCLMASFEDREMLSKEDRDVIKKLNLKFRGRNQWPLFRSYQPGYYPWYVTKAEAEFLTLALQQTAQMSLRFKEGPDMLSPPKRGQYLVRTPREAKRGLQWTDEWMRPQPMEKSKTVVPLINEIRLQKLKKTITRRGGTWEIDFFFTPTPVREGKEKPYYPYAALCVDKRSGLILHVDMLKPEEYMTGFPNSLMELIESTQMKPSEMLVRKEEASELLKPIASKLNIRLRLVRRLEVLEYVQASMFQFFC